MGPDGVVMSHWGLSRRVVMTRGGQVRRTGLKETGLGSGGGGGGFGGGGGWGRHQVSEYVRRLPTTTTATEKGGEGGSGRVGAVEGKGGRERLTMSRRDIVVSYRWSVRGGEVTCWGGCTADGG